MSNLDRLKKLIADIRNAQSEKDARESKKEIDKILNSYNQTYSGDEYKEWEETFEEHLKNLGVYSSVIDNNLGIIYDVAVTLENKSKL